MRENEHKLLLEMYSFPIRPIIKEPSIGDGRLEYITYAIGCKGDSEKTKAYCVKSLAQTVIVEWLKRPDSMDTEIVLNPNGIEIRNEGKVTECFLRVAFVKRGEQNAK